MKTKKLLILLAIMLIGMVGYSQTTLLKYNNTVNNQYKIRCTWEAGGVTYSTGSPGYEMIGVSSLGSIIVPQSNATLISFDIKTADCFGNWISFTAGTSADEAIGSCNQCSNNSAIIGCCNLPCHGI